MIPILVIVLWLQHTATDRLIKKTGIVPHPSIVETIGVATGVRVVGNDPTWMFKVEASREEVMNFYRKEGNRHGWSLVSDNIMIILERDDQSMSISHYKDWKTSKIIYILNHKTPENK